MMSLYGEMGRRIKMRRRELGLSQEGLAELAGITAQTVSSAERGTKALRPENIIKICGALKMSTDYLLLGSLQNDTFDKGILDQIRNLPEQQRQHLEIAIEHILAVIGREE